MMAKRGRVSGSGGRVKGSGKVEGDSSAKFTIVPDAPLPIDSYRLPRRGGYKGKPFDAQVDLLVAEISGLLEHVRAGLMAVGHNSLIDTANKSRVYCPKDTLELVKSGTLSAEATRAGARAQMSYGAKGLPFYAVTVHEGTARHVKPTRSKYLEGAFGEDTALIGTKVTENTKKLFPTG
jgi:hypothetical protein